MHAGAMVGRGRVIPRTKVKCWGGGSCSCAAALLLGGVGLFSVAAALSRQLGSSRFAQALALAVVASPVDRGICPQDT